MNPTTAPPAPDTFRPSCARVADDDGYPRLLELTIEEALALEHGEVPTSVRARAGQLARMSNDLNCTEVYGYIAFQEATEE